MSGTSYQLYSMNMAKACIEGKYDCVMINYRGLAGVPLTTPLVYHAADSTPLHDAIEYITESTAAMSRAGKLEGW